MAPELGEYAFPLPNPNGKTDFRTETFLDNLLESQDVNVVKNYKSAAVGRVRRMKLLDVWLHEYVEMEVYTSSSTFDSRTGMIRVGL
ncbi:hypothetical protein AN958_11189 [Leucoagaricus sp. SymC.cos]|nr:hypothetical protein AN958_11189 [Leucoagaricus sp. SymC.cos]